MTELPGPGGAPAVATPAMPDAPAPRRRPALSPSRAGDFKQCPLLYRFRAIDRLPERPSRAQVRGTLVHAVLERLFELPAAQRVPAAARDLVEPTWAELCAREPELAGQLFDGPDDPDAAPTGWRRPGRCWTPTSRWRTRGGSSPRPASCWSRPSWTRGCCCAATSTGSTWRPDGQLRVVDYKTGAAPRLVAEARALFQMKFYALALLHLRGVVPTQLRLLYLADGESLTYQPDEAELRRFERTLDAIWTAILRAGRDGDFRPNPSRHVRVVQPPGALPGLGRHAAGLPGLAGRPGRGRRDRDHARPGGLIMIGRPGRIGGMAGRRPALEPYYLPLDGPDGERFHATFSTTGPGSPTPSTPGRPRRC